ncbi:hypothetical protein OG455_10510 [Kitasatospora sp. NBC_01287]|uniref:hypothetical protein n=1 Tax=Kitasatospora sp. NBC_01287 TaxID=2903573 RepID=UPI0022506C94|nr:hypothetical protein [Kitasatospora sp. NBC_01287]MCX4745952.1 hypothetical protein [Kitasatospora sp. NBC_01287]
MLDSSLTADVPLGPFEGVSIAVRSAKGQNAKLHAATACTQLRTPEVVAAEVPLNADTIQRMCVQCAQYADWARPDHGLGIFLRALQGTGLLHQLQLYTEPDPDAGWDQAEVQAAAELLRADPYPGSDDGDDDSEKRDWQTREDTEHLRGRLRTTWREAARSLHLAGTTAARFPWLEEWAQPRLAVKENYLEALRAQAALFVDAGTLVAASVAAGLKQPELPVTEPAFSGLGGRHEVTERLATLWRKWHAAALGGRERPSERVRLSYHAMHGIRSNRKGYAEASAAVVRLIESWEEQLSRTVAAADPDDLVWATVRLPQIKGAARHQDERGLLNGLDDWTISVLITYLIAGDWTEHTLTLRLPQPAADRLLTGRGLDCQAHDARPTPTTPTPTEGPLRPGVFDDTPLHKRQMVTADHLRLLRSTRPAVDELYIVFSTDAGIEVLPLLVLEKRVAGGWQGFLVAGSEDLPADVIEPWVREVGPRPEDQQSLWPGHQRSPHDPYFGEHLGMAQGATRTAWLAHEPAGGERNLRLLAMARGVRDLRTLDAGYDDGGRSRGLPRPVWQGLLAHGQDLDLEPFEAPNTDHWRGGGSGIPLGVLADVQVYATNADPRYQGKGHSPFCSHSHERGAIVAEDDLMTVSDLLDDTYDWCSKCGGYAIRRLTDTQLSYYRAAHRLHDIAQQLDPERGGSDRLDANAVVQQLHELADWSPASEDHWYSGGARRWRRVVQDLQVKAEQFRRTTP